jgi:hypothetical protein
MLAPSAPPTSGAFVWLMPGTRIARFANTRPVGISAIVWLSITRWRVALWTSTVAAAPVTVMVSSTAPTCMSAFTVAVNDPVSSIPSRLTVLNPGSVNVTV